MSLAWGTVREVAAEPEQSRMVHRAELAAEDQTESPVSPPCSQLPSSWGGVEGQPHRVPFRRRLIRGVPLGKFASSPVNPSPWAVERITTMWARVRFEGPGETALYTALPW